MKATTKAIVLAAGKGTRMNSAIPKVLHIVAGKTIIEWVVEALEEVGIEEIILIVSQDNKDEIQSVLKNRCTYLIQEPQAGTAHAVLQAKEHLKDFQGQTIVMVGDAPGITAGELELLISTRTKNNLACTFLTVSVKDNKPPWGRIIYNSEGNPAAIVEERDASPEEKLIDELSSSHFIFDNQILFNALPQISNNNAQKEFYLSDVIEIIAREHKIQTIKAENLLNVYGINTVLEQKMLEEYLTQEVQSNLGLTKRKELR